MKSEGSHGSWYILTGLLLGTVAGMAIALLFLPVKFVETAPFSLSDNDKDAYRSVVALAFEANHDSGRAAARVQLLHDPDPVSALNAQAQRYLANGDSPETAQSLARLAIILNKITPLASQAPAPTSNITAVFSPVASIRPEDNSTSSQSPEPSATNDAATTPPDEPGSTPEPSSTAAPQETEPSPAATETLQAELLTQPAYMLDKKEEVCDPSLASPLLQVELVDQSGNPLAGVKVNVTWDSSEDNFYTGLHPEVDPGYADFDMAPEVKYNLRIGDNSEVFSNLEAVKCPSREGTNYWGGWKLQFTKP